MGSRPRATRFTISLPQNLLKQRRIIVVRCILAVVNTCHSWLRPWRRVRESWHDPLKAAVLGEGGDLHGRNINDKRGRISWKHGSVQGAMRNRMIELHAPDV